MSELFETAIVQKRNLLNELRSNNMSLQELRFFSIYLSKINPRDISTRVVKFPLDDFKRIMNLGKLNIQKLRMNTDSLLTKIIHIPTESGGYKSFQLFKECTVDTDKDGRWYVYIDAHDKALPLMFDFKDRYFKYELWNALRLKSSNQIRMYEILKQYENIGKRELTITELRELLGIAPHEYDRFERFRVRVLDSCQQVLKETTDICYTYERGKTGRGGKWITVIFYIYKNTEYTNPLSLDDFIAIQEVPDSDIDLKDNNDTTGQLSLFDNKNEIEPDDLISLACCIDADKSLCEFSKTEMDYIKQLIAKKELPEDQMGIEFARHHYLYEMYQKLNVYAEKQEIENRYAYLCKMIENDERF